MSYEYLKQRVGEAKLEHWIEKKVISSRPCAKTGAEAKELRDYWYTEDWQTDTTSDGVRESVTDQRAGDQKMIDRLDSMAGTESATPEVKVEPKTDADIMAQKVATLKSDGKSTLAKFQNQLTELRSIKSGCMNKKYAQDFVADTEKLIKKVSAATRMLEAVATGVAGKDYEEAKLENLVTTLEALDQEFWDTIGHAKCFGVSISGKSRGGKRKSA